MVGDPAPALAAVTTRAEPLDSPGAIACFVDDLSCFR